jgi:hypothetical protein
MKYKSEIGIKKKQLTNGDMLMLYERANDEEQEREIGIKQSTASENSQWRTSGAEIQRDC